jgi:hypothetical protein
MNFVAINPIKALLWSGDQWRSGAAYHGRYDADDIQQKDHWRNPAGHYATDLGMAGYRRDVCGRGRHARDSSIDESHRQ